jgi:hypothetical protein
MIRIRRPQSSAHDRYEEVLTPLLDRLVNESSMDGPFHEFPSQRGGLDHFWS